MSDVSAAKQAAARAAADLVEDGMRLGLGSGSTFLLVLEALAERRKAGRLDIAGVPTSAATAAAAGRLGIPLLTLDDVEVLDLAIDGADQVDPRKNLVKGGGGALVREKIVAAAARELLVVVDDRKLVDVLGTSFPLPVEVMQFGWQQAMHAIAATGCECSRRQTADGQPFVSDNGNFIVDCAYAGGIEDPAFLHDALNAIPGVIDNGLFVGMANRVIVARTDGSTRTME